MKRIKNIFFNTFNNIFFQIESWRRRRAIKEIIKETSKMKKAFCDFEKVISSITYPKNEFNQMMGMLNSDIEVFDHIVQRYRYDRNLASIIMREDSRYRFLGKTKTSFVMHPCETGNHKSLRIDASSLFVFGNILVNRILLLLEMYLPSDLNKDAYAKIAACYIELNKATSLTGLTKDFKDSFFDKIKWLHTVLRFYRNEFIEHLNKAHQQGINFSFKSSNDFSLSSYKWNYSDDDNDKVEAFRKVLLSKGVQIPERSSGGRTMINRFYVQKLFENITLVPDDGKLLKDALDLIDEIGGESPRPERIISEIENFIEEVLGFMDKNLDRSELAKYR